MVNQLTPHTDPVRRVCLSVKGRVQGVGFRPFVWNLAAKLGLTGWVQNESSGVTIQLQGRASQLETFLDNLQGSLPPLAVIDSWDANDVPVIDESRFLIRRSPQSRHPSAGLLSHHATVVGTHVGADLSTCDQCSCELRDPGDRRYQYPFINCTNCGPRFTIIESVPYDRARTTMKTFSMCPRCQAEYDDPSDRRFHAQPNACPECGPRIWFVSSKDHCGTLPSAPKLLPPTTDILQSFAASMRDGRIVAVKGIGGFHLACDARNIDSVNRLRHRKGRIDKPFAVMVADADQASAFAKIGDIESKSLNRGERPIVLLPKRYGSKFDEMLDVVAPGNACVGVMLPYSPLHHLLVEQVSPLLMTSGNLTDEPIARTNEQAIDRLNRIADDFLFHDRDIQVVCDDSVVRPMGTSVIPIRRSRGFAPLPIKLASPGPCVLAVGGEIKSTFCITHGEHAYVSQHLGDVGNLETLEALKDNVAHFQALFGMQLDAVAADLHPDYLSSQWARQLSQSLSLPLIRVQHHHAHVASLLAEHDFPRARPIVAVCFDGTGFGTDGSIWGGEFMIADTIDFKRVAHLSPLAMPGGDAGIQRPYRIGLALLEAAGVPWIDQYDCVAACPPAERKVLRQQLVQTLASASTSSMGRLFDGVASVIGIRHQINYEAQAAIELESVAAQSINDVDPDEYAFEFCEAAPTTIQYSGLISVICRDLEKGTDRGQIAAKFHHATAAMVAQACANTRRDMGLETVGLTGGVFQNALLLDLTSKRLRQLDFQVLTHAEVPPNDGGLALGQAVIAQNRLTDA